MTKNIRLFVLQIGSSMAAAAQKKQWKQALQGINYLVTNPSGLALRYSTLSGINIINVNGLALKNLNKNGKLDVYEDRRQPVGVWANHLTSKIVC